MDKPGDEDAGALQAENVRLRLIISELLAWLRRPFVGEQGDYPDLFKRAEQELQKF